MSADALNAEHARLEKMQQQQVKNDDAVEANKDWLTMDKIMQEEHEHEDDPEHFVMNDKELGYHKVLKQQQKEKREKEDDIRHHAWE